MTQHPDMVQQDNQELLVILIDLQKLNRQLPGSDLIEDMIATVEAELIKRGVCRSCADTVQVQTVIAWPHQCRDCDLADLAAMERSLR